MVEHFLRLGIERTKVIFDEQLVPDQNQLNNLKKVEKWPCLFEVKGRKVPNLSYKKI